MSSKNKEIGLLADVFRKETLDGTITKLRLDQIRPSEYQPRQDRLREVDELAASIKRDGLLHPIVVTKEGDHYRIISGERRYHALKSIGAREAECRILSREAKDLHRIAIIENLQRVDLTAQEEAVALLKLKRQENYSDQDLADRLSKSRNYITEILGVASLPVDVLKECLDAGIHSKNLMIQVVQAYKRGEYKNFVAQFRAGQIQTVRDAKEFNRPTGKTPLKKKATPAPRDVPRITADKNVIKIQFQTDESAREALQKIQRLFRS